MDRELFRLAAQGLKRKRKSSLLLFAVLCLSFAFAVVSLSVTSSMEATNQNFRLETYGSWERVIVNGQPGDESFLQGKPWLDGLGISRYGGELMGPQSLVRFGTADEGFVALGNLGLQDGRWPEKENEIALEANALSTLGYDYELGQELTVKTSLPALCAPEGAVTVEHTYTLCGVIKAYTSLWQFSSFSGSGPEYLNSGLVTEGTLKLLQKEAEPEINRLKGEAQKAIDKLKAEGQEIEPALAAQLKIALKSPAPTCIFTLKKGMGEEAQKAIRRHLDSQAETGSGAGTLMWNAGSFGGSQEQELNFHYFYGGLIFAATVFAILCIYALQLPRQVRQIALFRSVGITKRQLRRLALYENLILCLPALVLGAAAGAGGTWAALRLVVYSGSAPIEVSLPWALLGAMAAVWVLGVFFARLIILQVALREPLIGRIAMASKKARRLKRAQTALVAVLASLLCGAMIFTTLEMLNPIGMIESFTSWPSYNIYGGTTGKALEDYSRDPEAQARLISPAWAAMAEGVPGVASGNVSNTLTVEMRFAGMEGSDFYQGAREAAKISNEAGFPRPAYSPNALAANLCVISDRELKELFDFGELGIDPEAFRRGEEVLLFLPTDVDGSYYVGMPIIEKEDQWGYQVERRHYKKPGIKTGDTVNLTIFGHDPLPGRFIPWEERGLVSLWQFSPKATVIPVNIFNENLRFPIEPYTVLCSYDYLEQVFPQLEPGYEMFNTITGGEFGYDCLFLSTDRDAGYLATDVVIAGLCEEQHFMLLNDREKNAAEIQENVQTVILLATGGGCAALLLLLILGNTFSLELEREKRNYGVLQALGLSKRQLRRRILKTAALRGIFGGLAGWLLFGIFLLADAPRVLAEEVEYAAEYNMTPAFTTVWGAFWESIHDLQVDGANLWLALALTAAGIMVIVCLSLLSKRRLFREDLMEKLRNEQ